jgi:ABC-type spermidine/putrescine transport system permease subunit II
MEEKRKKDKQVIVFWLIIILISLFLIMPTLQKGITSFEGEQIGGFWDTSVDRYKLCVAVGLVTFGLIVSFRTKKKH